MKSLICAIFLAAGVHAAEKSAQETPKGPPPKPVVTGEVGSQKVTMQNAFIGSIFFEDISNVATEVSGIVQAVKFREGERVKKGQPLVQLNTDLLIKQIESTDASYKRALADLENARKELTRIENLYKEGSVAERLYDENRFNVLGLENAALSLRAELDRLNLEKRKKIIKAPFDGIVLNKMVYIGDWMDTGASVAEIARDDVVEAEASIPEEFLKFIKPGTSIPVTTGGHEMQGTVRAIIAKGDMTTRTFPVKITLKNTKGLKEGMEAKIFLPAAQPREGLVVPRDAIISLMGQNMIFTIVDGKATPMPVQVLEYKGSLVGVEAENLQPGMPVITKGHERLAPMQAVVVINKPQ